ncbi:MAG: restriction endonuclease [Flavobacteriales bacterium]|nr:restriction endonuclease [Flavobacteriales bacterium]MBK9629327.1 restriction endonuclease [Flavobacteriales bacterium]
MSRSAKSAQVQRLEAEALDILASVGIPVNDKTVRAKQMMAVCLLSVAGITKSWSEAKGLGDGKPLKTREIIAFANKHLGEKISPGSYDDIRRKHLKLMVLADLIVNSGDNPSKATNDPTRGNALHPDFKKLVKTYGTPTWKKNLADFNKNRPSLAETLLRKRDMKRIPVTLPGGGKLELSLGKHNELQKAIIEQFLPLWGNGAEVLYVGDTSNKLLHIERARLKELGFFDLSHDELPDIIAYSKSKKWLYVIEAVHSSGPISELRLMELKKLLKGCKAGIVYVTAFLTRKAHAKYADQIAYETEVWTADRPEHLQHLNGPRFIGPYS